MYILLRGINQRSIQITPMHIQRILQCLGFLKRLVRLFSAFFLLTGLSEPIAEIPQEHASAIQCPNGFFRREPVRRRRRRTVGGQAVEYFAREEDPKLINNNNKVNNAFKENQKFQKLTFAASAKKNLGASSLNASHFAT